MNTQGQLPESPGSGCCSRSNLNEYEITFEKGSLQGKTCDNDCGTYFCISCSKEYYQSHTGQIVWGHNPNCGDDGDDAFVEKDLVLE
jgi:hypothetical protein